MTTLLTPQAAAPAMHRYTPPAKSHHLDNLPLSERFWEAVQLDSPTSSAFDRTAFLPSTPVDEKILRVLHVDDAATATATVIDDPIVAFETWDCYSPVRPTFPSAPTSGTHHWDGADAYARPCPHGESPVDVCTSPAPTLASIRYHHHPILTTSSNHATSPWTRLRDRPSPSRASSTHRAASAAVIALASAFLDGIVRLARSRTATPTACHDGAGTVRILESEVRINVLEDERWAASCAHECEAMGGMEWDWRSARTEWDEVEGRGRRVVA